MIETVFKVGDRVFDITFGWGNVIKIDFNYVFVEYDKKEFTIQAYVKGKEILLSFTEYTLDGFSQERPINYEDYIDKWGMFYDEEQEKDLIYKFGKLQRIQHNNTYRFNPKDSIAYYEFFEPLTEEQIEILGLTNKNVDNEEHI